MKRIGDLMADLGFREDAPESVKKAFIEGLMKSLPAPHAELRPENSPKKKASASRVRGKIQDPNQLSLFDETETLPNKDGKQAG